MARKTCTDPKILESLDRLEAAARSISGDVEFTRVYQVLGSHEPRWQNVGTILSHLNVPPEIRFCPETDKIGIHADPMLEKVFYNLLDNSIRHGGKVRQIRVHAKRLPEGLIVIWEDDGQGVPATDKELIFSRGYGHNSGLGLFLVREILAITGITIRENGAPGCGARFEILVPPDHFQEDGTAAG
jgi:signal transduction histidine kinase